MELLNDNRAALILASNQGGGWRTRHLRIRANCLAEAVDTKEVDLQHRVGTKLWADSLTKVLAAPSLQRFKEGIGLRSSSDEVLVGGPKLKVSRVMGLNEDIKDRLLKALLILLLAGATMDDVKAATGKEMDLNSSEVPKGAELSGELVCLLLGLGAMVIYKLISEVGMAVIRRIVAGEETQPELKVKLLDEKAVEPSRGSDEAAGYDMATCRDFVLQPGESRLVSTGIALQVPKGTYGRIASRSSLASRGIEVCGGVVDGDYRVAQIILEKFEGVPVKKVDELSESRRGSKGFGSSGKKIHLKVLRGCSVESNSGSEGSWSFINESEEASAAVWSSEEGRRGNEEHLVIPMAADGPGRSSNAVRDAAEQSNEDGAAVRGGSHERRGVDLEGGRDGAPMAAYEVAEIVSGIHRYGTGAAPWLSGGRRGRGHFGEQRDSSLGRIYDWRWTRTW